MNFLSLDIGTTRCKSQVFSEDGEILFSAGEDYPTAERDGERYVDIGAICRHVFAMMKAAAAVGYGAVCISSFGESFVLLGKNDEVLFPPMLYTDPRGAEEAALAARRFGADALFAATGAMPDAMYSVYKLLWVARHRPDVYRKADKLLLIGDYIGYLLTGERAIDYGLAARTGAFDVRGKCFAEDLLRELGVPRGLFSRPMPTGSVVGELKDEIKAELGLAGGCKLVLGSHDQICATLGAGVLESGCSADGMGTVECITAVFDEAPHDPAFGRMGFCVVPFADGLYCTYMFNYTSNAAVNWFRRGVLHGYKGDEAEQFAYLERNLPPPSDVLMVPHLAGSATPCPDKAAKGAFLNITESCTDLDLYRAILEGTAYEMKCSLDAAARFGIRVREATATGGGANSAPWLQIKSDILGVKVRTLRSSEGGLCGCAMLSAAALEPCMDLHEAGKRFVRYKDEYSPQSGYAEIYAKKYANYKKLYRLLKEVR